MTSTRRNDNNRYESEWLNECKANAARRTQTLCWLLVGISVAVVAYFMI